MSQSPAAPSPPAAPKPSKSSTSKSGEPRYFVLFLLTVLVALAGGLVTAVTVGALLSFVPSIFGTAIGLVVGFGLPLFLALRAAAALKRRRRGLLMRRLVALALIVATQLAVTGAVLQYSSRTTGNVAWTAFDDLDVFGGVPIVSDLLYAHAEQNNAIPGTALAKKPGAKPGPDGGPAPLVDGGPAKADAGAARADAGGAPVDAGTAAVDAGTAAGAPTIQPPAPKPGVGLSPRTEGKPARSFALSVATDTGDTVLLVGTVGSGGTFSERVVELGAAEKLGDPTVVECADDGTAAAILGGSHLVVARAGRTAADVVKPLEPGQKLAGKDIQAVRDVVIGAGGKGLAIVDVLTGENGGVAEELVALPHGASPPLVLRKAGDKVPGASTDATVVKSFSFKKSSGADSVLVAETYLDGGADVGTRMSGDTFLLNPERLLAVKLDAPKAQTELARTGTEPSGIDGKELQIFGDAWLLPDGRAVFDANFLEQGKDGWLFFTKPAGGLFALAPELRAKTAPWSTTPPRAQYLEAGSDGTLVFRRGDGAVVLTSLDKPGEASAGLLHADALAPDGTAKGTVTSVDAPMLVRGGAWVLASARLQGATAHDAVVLASRADLQNGKAEVLVEVGARVPDKPARAKPRTIQSLRFLGGRDELLWQK